jgi:hypothetical protein
MRRRLLIGKKLVGVFDRFCLVIAIFDISVLRLFQCLEGGGVGRHARHARTHHNHPHGRP